MPKLIEGNLIATGMHAAIVVSRFNEFITSKLLGAAVDTILGKGRGSFLSSWDGLHEAPDPIIPGAAWQGENQRCHSLRPLFGCALPWV